MSTSTADDPVQVGIDILDGTADGDYTGSKPTRIAKAEAFTASERLNAQVNALYVHRPVDGAFDQFGSRWTSYTETQVIQIEAWVPGIAEANPEDKAFELAKDVRDYIFTNFNTDPDLSETNYREIVPISGIDFRQEAVGNKSQLYIAAIQVELEALRST